MIPWHPHTGGARPYAPETMVRPRIRVVDRSTVEKREFTRADGWKWPHRRSPGDIMEFQRA